MPITAVENRRLYRQIADQIAALIDRGEYSAGQRLPPERDLAKQLGVSRPSVREALIALEVEGYVEVRVGSGVYVVGKQPVLAKLPADSGPFELISARSLIEGECAALAAKSATRAQVRAIEEALEEMESQRHKGQTLAADRLLHLRIAEATGNSALALAVQTLWDQRMGPLFLRLEHHFDTPALWTVAIKEHRDIVAAIGRHDPGGARAAMRRHMQQAARRFSTSWDKAKGGALTEPAQDAVLERTADEFTVHEEPVDLSQYRFEDWVALAIFWSLAGVIFYQFFTRYALNDSASWTEEIARYLLIGVAFVGAAMNVRKNNHIHVDFFYRLVPRWAGRALAVAVDVLRVAFLGYCVWLTWLLITKIGSSRMAIVDLPMGIVYGVVMFGFGLMFVRALQVAIGNWKRGYSVLERPELAEEIHGAAPAAAGGK